MTPDDARQLALALPEAVEQDHHGRPSFRVGGKIFATLWDERTMNVMVTSPGSSPRIDAAIPSGAQSATGQATRGSRGRLSEAFAGGLAELLTDASGGKRTREAEGLTTAPAGTSRDRGSS